MKEMAMTALRKVLVVDDDPVVHKSFDRVLSGRGYAVITAADGEEALSKLAAEKYDVVYTDIRMPGMSGLEVAEQVKAREPWTPVVIITGYGSDEAEARAKDAGVVGFLHKPLTPEMIEGSAETALAEAPASPAPVKAAAVEAAAVEAAPLPEGATVMGVAKNILLFLAAPFVALAYIIALPFVGLAILAVVAARAAARNQTMAATGLALKKTGLFVAAPFIALAFVIALPFIGLAMLAWAGVAALFGVGKPERAG
jgi:CheY-like chemotaxis protein